MEEKKTILESTLERYRGTAGAGDQQALIALLREVQQLYGCVPTVIQQRIAQATETSPSLVAALVKRIPGLTEAEYRHQITVCTGPRCSSKGGIAVLRAIQDALGILPGETTTDGRFHLETRNCLKKCGNAPNVMIDSTINPSVRPEQVSAIIDQYS